MDKKSQENRRSAARQFMSALDELELVLQSEVASERKQAAQRQAADEARMRDLEADSPEDLADLFDAAAEDIEQFMTGNPEAADQPPMA